MRKLLATVKPQRSLFRKIQSRNIVAYVQLLRSCFFTHQASPPLSAVYRNEQYGILGTVEGMSSTVKCHKPRNNSKIRNKPPTNSKMFYFDCCDNWWWKITLRFPCCIEIFSNMIHFIRIDTKLEKINWFEFFSGFEILARDHNCCWSYRLLFYITVVSNNSSYYFITTYISRFSHK